MFSLHGGGLDLSLLRQAEQNTSFKTHLLLCALRISDTDLNYGNSEQNRPLESDQWVRKARKIAVCQGVALYIEASRARGGN